MVGHEHLADELELELCADLPENLEGEIFAAGESEEISPLIASEGDDRTPTSDSLQVIRERLASVDQLLSRTSI